LEVHLVGNRAATEDRRNAELANQEWRKVSVVTATTATIDLVELVQQYDFTVKVEGLLIDSSNADLSQDLFAQQRPDLAIISKSSGQTGILIEVKQATPSTHKELDASQFVRNLLFLLGTTDQGRKAHEPFDEPFSWRRRIHGFETAAILASGTTS